MSREYLKKAPKSSSTDAGDVRATVQGILDQIEAGGGGAARRARIHAVRPTRALPTRRGMNAASWTAPARKGPTARRMRTAIRRAVTMRAAAVLLPFVLLATARDTTAAEAPA